MGSGHAQTAPVKTGTGITPFEKKSYDNISANKLRKNLAELNAYFHKDTGNGRHEHKIPGQGDLPAMEKLRAEIRNGLQELGQTTSPAELMTIVTGACCTPAITYLNTGTIQ